MSAELLQAVASDQGDPWPGLDYFDERAAALFHGRDLEIAELARRVPASAVTVLFGKSGLGKTSLLRAGVFPRLRAGNFLPVYVRFDLTPSATGLLGQIQARLIAELRAARVDFPQTDPGETLWEYLHRTDLELWSEHNYRLTPVFVFDQFEELFTLGAANPRRIDQLRTELGDLVENRIPSILGGQRAGASRRQLDLHAQRYRTIISLREDFLAELESSAWADAMPSMLQRENRMPLRPMSPNQAFQAVHLTSRGLIDEALAWVVVRFIAGAPQPQAARMALRGETAALGTTTTFAPAGSVVEPALLSLLCRELNEVRKTARKRTIDLRTFEEHKDTIISNYYRRSIGDLPDQVGRFIERELITRQGFRNSFPLHDAVATGLVTEDQIRLLVDRRILRLEERYGTHRVELTHDLLTHSVRENRARREEEDAKRIEHERLEEERKLHQQEVERLDAENRRQRSLKRMWTRFATINMALVLVAGAVMLYAFVQRDRARVAEGQARAALVATASTKAASESVAFSDPAFGVPADVSALLAVAGHGLSANIATRRGLLSAYQRLLDVHAILPHGFPVGSVAFSPDGTKIAAAGWGKSLAVWDAGTGQPVGRPLLGHEGAVTSIAFNPAGSLLASSGADGTVRIWNVAGGPAFGEAVGEPLRGHSGRVLSVRFSPDGRVLASAGADKKIVLWNVDTHQRTVELKGHDNAVKSIAFRPPDGRMLASGGFDGSVILWDVASGSQLGKPLGVSAAPASSDSRPRDDGARVMAVAFSADGSKLASATYDNTVTLWDPQTRKMSPDHLRDSLERHLLSMDLAADGNSLVTSTREGTITLRTLEAGPPASWSTKTLSSGGSAVLAVAFGPKSDSGSNPLVSASWDGSVVLWDLVRPIQAAERRSWFPDRLDGAAYSPDGTMLAFAGKEKSVVLWSVAERHPIDHLGAAQHVASVAFSPNGKTIASGGVDGEVILWDASTHRKIGGSTSGHTQRVTGLAFSPDSQTLASGSDDQTVLLWSVATQPTPGKTLQQPGKVIDLAFSDGRTLVVATGDGRLTSWDTQNGRTLAGSVPASEDDSVSAFALTPDGSRVVSTGRAGSLVVRDTVSWTAQSELAESSRSRVLKLLPYPRGDLFAAVGSGNTIILRDFTTLESLGAVVTSHQAQFDAAALSPSGEQLATIGKGESVVLWDADIDTFSARLCSKLRRNLSRSEWTRYVGDTRDVPYRVQCQGLPVPER